MSSDKKWYSDGLKFECQGSGKCCVSRGEYGFVYLDKNDRKRLAKHLKVTTKQFIKDYCSTTDGYCHLKVDPKQPECFFLINNKCSAYEGRPTQCKTWPFWPETLDAKAWRSDVVEFCPGAGKGKIHSQNEIDATAAEQRESEILMDKV